MDPAFDRNHLALGAILANVFAQTVEASDTVEFCILDRKAFFILVGFAFTVAGGAVGYDWQHLKGATRPVKKLVAMLLAPGSGRFAKKPNWSRLI
mgnify:CR=1 FL=1